MQIKTYNQAVKYIYSFIPKQYKQKFPGNFGLERMKYFLDLLDNPQEKYKVLHVAGTSGKGSTSYILSSLLESQGFYVGLTLSPHIVDIRERIQLNNDFIEKKKFIRYVNLLVPIIDKVKASEFGVPTYFEIMIALSYYSFFIEKVDYAVVETGLGGTFDGTNVVQSSNKVSIITPIGLDHMRILGTTLSEVAEKKAGIINNKSQVFSSHQTKEAEEIITNIAKERKSYISYVRDENIKNIKITEDFTSFDYYGDTQCLKNIQMSLLGEYQARNATLVLNIINHLSKRDKFDFDRESIRKAFSKLFLIGRFDIKIVNKKKVILDGAHNPSKMKNFIQSVIQLYPKKKHTFIVAIKERKNHIDILKEIIPVAKQIVVTNFSIQEQDFKFTSVSPKLLAQDLKKLDFHNIEIIEDPKKALSYSLKQKEDIIISGSLYLLAKMYNILQDDNAFEIS